MRRTRRCLLVLILFHVLAATAYQQAAATQFLQVRYGYDGHASGGSGGFVPLVGFDLKTLTPVPRSGSVSVSNGAGSIAKSGDAEALMSVSAFAQVGALGVEFAAVARDGSDQAFDVLSETQVKALWSDDPFLAGPTVGRFVKIHSSIKVHGDLTTSTTGNFSSAQLFITGTNLPAAPYANDLWITSIVGVTSDPPNYIDTNGDNIKDTFSIPVVYSGVLGERANIDFGVTLSGAAEINTLEVLRGRTAVVTGAFGQTLTWNGITSVEDAVTGEPIEGWSLMSDSGFDYSQPFVVPEPSSILLLGIGAVALLSKWRRSTGNFERSVFKRAKERPAGSA